MNDPLDELYQTIIIEHSRNPHHFGKLDAPACCAEGYNPLCGDRIGACVELNGEIIQKITCFGSGCAISKASASLMTDLLEGQPLSRFDELFGLVQKALQGDQEAAAKLDELGDIVALKGVSKFPARVKCAMLGWQSLRNAIQGDDGEFSL